MKTYAVVTFIVLVTCALDFLGLDIMRDPVRYLSISVPAILCFDAVMSLIERSKK